MATLYRLNQFFVTTLNVGGGITNSQTTGIVIADDSGIDDVDEPGIALLSYADPLNTTNAEWITYTSISSNELQGVTRGAEGFSAKAHDNGVQIAFPISKSHINNIIDKLNGVDTLDSDLDLGSTVNIKVNGSDPKRGLYIPASALFPATTSGCATLAQGETSSNKINYKYLAFDQSTEEYAWINLPTPDYWDLSTVTIKFHWTAASGTGDVIWGAAGLCRGDDDALDTALGTAQTVTDTLLATGDEHTTSATSAITIGGTPAKGDKLYLRVYRDADAAGDTLNADAHLTGITVKFGIGQYDDQ